MPATPMIAVVLATGLAIGACGAARAADDQTRPPVTLAEITPAAVVPTPSNESVAAIAEPKPGDPAPAAPARNQKADTLARALLLITSAGGGRPFPTMPR